MRRLLPILLCIVWMSLPTVSAAQQANPTLTPAGPAITDTPSPEPDSQTPGILYPKAGETLQGSIPIRINLPEQNFNAWELAFAPAENPTDTWFVLARGIEPFSGELLRWDTTRLTDGDYSLRLRLFFSDAYRDLLISPLKIRNYTADTPTPQPTASPSATPQATARVLPTSTATASIPTARPSPTPLPDNPAILRTERIAEAALRGAGFSLLVFAAIGLVAWLKTRLVR